MEILTSKFEEQKIELYFEDIYITGVATKRDYQMAINDLIAIIANFTRLIATNDDFLISSSEIAKVQVKTSQNRNKWDLVDYINQTTSFTATRKVK